MKTIQNLKIALYVTGSIAAYKSLLMTRLLVQVGAHVRVVMTKGAQAFIQPLSFQTLAKHPVITDDTSGVTDGGITHIELAQWTDLALVLPADANTIAKMANGIADNIVTTTLLATQAPKVIVPAMNDQMWANAATQRNLNQLKQDGVRIIAPTVGPLAEGYQARGRMAEPINVLKQLTDGMPQSQLPLQKKRILITAGATRQPIDPVRFITNASSGKMGIAVAQAAVKMGAHVTLICADVRVPLPQNIQVVRVQTTTELQTAVLKLVPQNDVLIMTAAVADFQSVQIQPQKIKKASQSTNFSLTFKPAADILQAVAQIKRSDQYIVGFAAETNDLKQHAMHKLKAKHLNLLVANDVANHQIGFSSDNNQVTFFRNGHAPVQTAVLPKPLIAEQLLKIIADDLD